MNTRLLTVSEVAAILGVPKSWVYERSRQGLIPTVELGRYRRGTGSGGPAAGGVKRALGPRCSPGSRDGLTRSQAEAELRRRMGEKTVVIGRAERKTVGEAGERYVDHLAFVKQRKRTTIEDYRGYLRRHLVPFFGERALDRIEPAHAEEYLHAKLATLAPKTVTNHLTFLHGLLAFAVRRGWTSSNPLALVDRPPAARQHRARIRFLQPVEVEALLRAVADDELGARHHASDPPIS
jgi:excisionase family DNA binding protein